MAKDRTLDPAVAKAAVSLRVSGVSERAVYEHFRDKLETAPSYRDLRATYRNAGVLNRHDATVARHEGKFPTTTAVDEKQAHRSDYKERLAITREVDKTPDAKDALDENYVLGHLARAGVDPSTIEDPALRERLENIYDGVGS